VPQTPLNSISELELLDRRETPVVVAAEAKGRRAGDGVGPGQVPGERLLPHEARREVGDRAVAVVPVGRLHPVVLRVLAGEGLPRLRAGDLVRVVVAAHLIGVDDDEGGSARERSPGPEPEAERNAVSGAPLALRV